MSRHNPEFLAHIRNDYFPYSFFNFDNDATVVTLLNEGKTERISLSNVPVKDMHLEGTTNSESIVVTQGNELFNFTQTTTIYTGSNSTEQTELASCFATMTESIQTDNPNVTLVMLQFDLQTKGTNPPVKSADNSYIGLIDTGMKTIGELIFSSQSRPDQIVTPSDKNALDYNVLYAYRTGLHA